MPTIDITPPNRIYGTFSRLNYKPWYAIAEFVDNATQNFFDHAQEIADVDDEALLDIDITYSPSTNTLSVRDNANGMNLEELTHALKISSPPADTSGRSEFGMGLKTAACWFGPVWGITTSRLGDDHQYSITFDVEQLGASGDHDIAVIEKRAEANSHFTEITIKRLHSKLNSSQIKKIKDTLRSMYRVDLESGTVEIRWNGDPLYYEAPELFEQERPDGTTLRMRQEIDITVTDPNSGRAHHVTGWVGVLNKMSSAHNGFALIRRGRLILGGPEDEAWRPKELVGAAGSLEWKRMVGELSVDSFSVNFTKDGFHWEGGLEDALVEAMVPLVAGYKGFARDLRTRTTGGSATPKDFARVVEEVQAGVQEPGFRDAANQLAVPRPVDLPPESIETSAAARVPATLEVPLPGGPIHATLYLKDHDPSGPWLKIAAPKNDVLDIELNTRHPFVAASTTDERGTTILGRIVLALAIAEQQGRITHGDMVPADSVRTWLSTILLHSRPDET